MANVNIIGQRDYLISPMIDLSTAPAATSLSFSLAYTGKYASDTDSLIVSVSDDCGATWTAISIMGESAMTTAPPTTSNFVPTAVQWETVNVSLTPYVGSSNVMIMFETYSGWGNMLYVDDVIVEDVTGVEEQTSSQMKVYPNPSNGIFTVENSIPGLIVVTDVAGRVVTEEKVNGGVNTLDLSSQSEGCYFMTMRFEDGTVVTERILIQ
jgi:Secretion system C-terminal sorting domain